MIGPSLQGYCRGKTPFPLKEKTHFSLSPGTRFEFIDASVYAVFGNCGQDCLLVTSKLTCCQLFVALVLQECCNFPMALPLLSSSVTVMASLHKCDVRVV